MTGGNSRHQRLYARRRSREPVGPAADVTRQTRAGLDESRELTGAILSSLPGDLVVLDRSGTILFASGASNGPRRPGGSYLAAFADGALGGPSLAQQAAEGIRAVCEGCTDLFTLQYRRSTDHGPREYLMTVAPLRRKHGGAVVTQTQIVGSNDAGDTALRDSEARFRLLAEALPICIWLTDPDGRRTYTSHSCVDIAGVHPNEPTGTAWTYSLHPEDRDQYLATYIAALVERQPYSIEYRVRRPDGSNGWLMDRAVPWRGTDGTFRGFVGGTLDLTERKEHELAVRSLTGRVISAEEEDRRRIARDLHDDVSQLVGLLAIEIEQLAVAPAYHADLPGKVQSLCQRAQEIAREVHRVAHALHPWRLHALGLVSAMAGLCAETTRQQTRVEFTHLNVPHRLPSDITLCFFRVAQEALRNVMTHSGATEAHVELTGSGERLTLRVSDNGRGFDHTTNHPGLGLVSMQERVRHVRGELRIDSREGGGTRIEVELPMPTAAEDAARCTPAPAAP
jgi:PAS domain S-box-containing protein